MKRLLFVIALLSALAAARAQNRIEGIVAQIEANNTELKALAAEIEAAKAENLSSVALADPEVEFGYLFGQPTSIGNRHDFSVTQSFDFATLTGANSAVARRRNDLLAIEYKAKRMEVLTRARTLCIELIYCNAIAAEVDKRLEHAETVADAYTTMIEAGSANRLEYNKAMLNLASAKGEAAKANIERENVKALLVAINGGEEVAFETVEFEPVEPLHSFEEWYAQAEQTNPVLEYARGEVELQREQLRRTKNEALPTIKAGYTSEIVVGQSFRGFQAGISIPLWSSGKRIGSAKQAVVAAESRREDARIRFRAEVRAQYERAAAYGRTAASYQQVLDELGGMELLDKALDEGAMSLIDYTVETGIYYDTVEKALAAERDWRIALAELRAYEM